MFPAINKKTRTPEIIMHHWAVGFARPTAAACRNAMAPATKPTNPHRIAMGGMMRRNTIAALNTTETRVVVSSSAHWNIGLKLAHHA